MAYKTPKTSITIAPDETTGTSVKISSNKGVHQGTVFFAKIVIPDYENDVTTTINVLDDEDEVVYSFAGLAKGVTHIVSDFQCPLIEKESFSAELSGAHGGESGYTIYVTLYYFK